MSNTIFITANWTTGALSQQTISRQYDNNRYAVQFIGYPEGDGTEELDLYLLVWMSTAPGQKPGEITPIQLNSDQWYISNYFTQQVQVIKFQLCVLNEAGTYEAHSPIFSGRIGDSLEHDGTSQDIDVSTLFDAYREYVEELIIGAGAVIIDPAPTQGSNNAVSSGGVWDEIANVNDFEKSTFKNPITFSRLTSSSMWAFGQEIVEATGANAVNNKAGRSTYIEFAEPVLIVLDNAEYEYVVWVYSSNSISGALYSPIKAYKNKPLIILPKASTSYFRIGVKRADGAVLTTDYSDTTSDAYKILNALHTYTLTSHTLDVDNVPIDAKAVKDNALVFKGFLDDNVDLNSVTDSGVYVLLSNRNYSNSPITVGYLFVYKIETVKAQLAYSLGTSETFLPSVYVRYGSGSGSTISSVWRMIGRGRKRAIKMACFGDSIMYGRNGNTSSQVEEQYRIPSILAYNLNIETTNYGVGSQGYIGLISETAYDNISAKDLTQFNAMLMCYGVNDGYKNLGTWDSTDETTIMGQFNKIVAYVFSQNPSIRLIVVAPYNGRNVGTFPKYWYGDRTHPDGYVSRQVLSDTLKQACEYYNIPYIEQKNSPINGYTIQTLIGTDGVHPSLEGYLQLGAWLSGEVGKLIG